MKSTRTMRLYLPLMMLVAVLAGCSPNAPSSYDAFTIDVRRSLVRYPTNVDTSTTLRALFRTSDDTTSVLVDSLRWNGHRVAVNDSSTRPWYGYARSTPFAVQFGDTAMIDIDGAGDIPSFSRALVLPRPIHITGPYSGILIRMSQGLPITWQKSAGPNERLYLFLESEKHSFVGEYPDTGGVVIPPKQLEPFGHSLVHITIIRTSIVRGVLGEGSNYRITLTTDADTYVQLID